MEIIYTDPHIIVINKPPGISVHGGISVSGATLIDELLKTFPEIRTVGDDPSFAKASAAAKALADKPEGKPNIRPGIVHRLDKDTSGVMVVARNQKSFEVLKNLFKTRQITKTYLAIVCGTPKQKKGVVEFPIGRLVKNPLRRGVEARHARSVIRGAREAYTEYRVLKAGGGFSLIELKPKTGRMHQLRVHLKTLGTPVACDRVYGGKNVCCPQGTSRQLLHAQSLSFSMPDAGRLFFEADPPEDFQLAQHHFD